MPWRTWASTASALPRQASARPGASPTTRAPKGGRKTAGSTSSWTSPSSSEESAEQKDPTGSFFFDDVGFDVPRGSRDGAERAVTTRDALLVARLLDQCDEYLRV